MVSYSLLPTDGLSVITDFYQPMCDANLVLWYSELGDGVLVDLALLLHELLQLYTKRHRVLNGRASIELHELYLARSGSCVAESILPSSCIRASWLPPGNSFGHGRTLHILHM